MEEYAGGLVADKGGPSEVSAGELHMIEVAQIARGCTMLILAEAARKGFIRVSEKEGGWDVAPGVKDLPKFLSLERSAVSDLGLGRRAKPVDEIIIKRFASGPGDGEGNL